MHRGWWYAIALLGLLGVLLRLDLLLWLCFFLALLGGGAWLWQRTCLNAVTYRRRPGTTRLFLGEETTLDIEITNAKPLPLAWLRADDEFPDGLTITPERDIRHARPGWHVLSNLVALRWYERVTRHYRLAGLQRGRWRIGPAALSSGDIFGFTIQRQALDDALTVLVYPRLVPLTALGLPSLRPFGELRTPRRLADDPLRLMGARVYAPGDSYRHIHWKATARRQELQTKVFEPAGSRPLAIFLNVNTYEYLYQGADIDLREFAISAAASIARWGIENGQPAGLYTNSVIQPGGARVRIPPAAHPDQQLRILEALAAMTAHGWWAFSAMLQEEMARLPYGTTVVVVSAVINDPLRALLDDLQRRDFGVALVSLGDAPPTRLPNGLRHYYIGDRETWYALETLALA